MNRIVLETDRPQDRPQEIDPCLTLEFEFHSKRYPAWWPVGEPGPVWLNGVLQLWVPVIICFRQVTNSAKPARTAVKLGKRLIKIGYRNVKVEPLGRGVAWIDREGRALPVDRHGRPMCPGCHRYNAVRIVAIGTAECLRCDAAVHEVPITGLELS